MIGVIRCQQIEKLQLGEGPSGAPLAYNFSLKNGSGTRQTQVEAEDPEGWCVAQQSVTLRAVQRRRPGDPPRADSLSSITLTREGSTEK
jgi:hypothetical protein